MNLEEIRAIIGEMQELRRVQKAARCNMIKFLCGTEEKYVELNRRTEDKFSLRRLDWKSSLEYAHGGEWANVFAFLTDEPSEDQILENLFTLITRDPQVHAIMLSEYNRDVIEEKIVTAKFIAGYRFPINHHMWIAMRINEKNAAVTINPQMFEKVERSLSNIWRCVLDYAIACSARNWITEDEFNDRFTDAYGMLNNIILPCIELSEKYLSAMAWMDEYEDWKRERSVD